MRLLGRPFVLLPFGQSHWFLRSVPPAAEGIYTRFMPEGLSRAHCLGLRSGQPPLYPCPVLGWRAVATACAPPVGRQKISLGKVEVAAALRARLESREVFRAKEAGGRGGVGVRGSFGRERPALGACRAEMAALRSLC